MATEQGYSLTETSWSMRDPSDQWEVGAIYLSPDESTSRYMATNGKQWEHLASLDLAVAWITEHPRPRPLRAVDGRRWQEDPRVWEEALERERAARDVPNGSPAL